MTSALIDILIVILGGSIVAGGIAGAVNHLRPHCPMCLWRKVWRDGQTCRSCAEALAPRREP